MTRYSIIAITTVCVVLSACASATVQPDADGRVHGTVVSVADGDTVTVKFASGQEKIRLIGIDTPETVHPTKPVGCFGPEADPFKCPGISRGGQTANTNSRNYFFDFGLALKKQPRSGSYENDRYMCEP